MVYIYRIRSPSPELCFPAKQRKPSFVVLDEARNESESRKDDELPVVTGLLLTKCASQYYATPLPCTVSQSIKR